MRKNLNTALRAALVALAAVLSFPEALSAEGRSAQGSGNRPAPGVNERFTGSVLRISSNSRLPSTRRVTLGSGKSMMIEFEFDLRDVLVADPDKADAVVQSSNRVFLIAKKSGQTNAFFFDTHGQQVLTLEVAIGADLEGLSNLLGRLIPGSNIKTETAGNAIVLTGTVRTPLDSKRAHDIAKQFAAVNLPAGNAANAGPAGDAGNAVAVAGAANAGGNSQVTTQENSQQNGQDAKVINLLAVEGEEQVMLRVTVAEVQRSLLKQFGINLGALINSGNFSTAILTDNALPLTTAAGLGTLPLAGIAANTLGLFNQGPSGPDGPTYGNSGVDSLWTTGNARIAGALRALERDGLIRTLAEPNLTAVSGESARFLAGGEIPYVTAIDPNTGSRAVSFKEFGIQLAFTPVVLSEGRISLKIDTAVSEISQFIGGNPVFNTRQAKTTVEIPSGGSLALAGLLSEDTRQNIDGFPGLKDLPILGTLFRSRDFTKKETELVVIVSPYMVRPTARQDLARPLDGLGDPSDRKANFLGHLNRIYGHSEAMPAGDLKGDYGFIVE